MTAAVLPMPDGCPCGTTRRPRFFRKRTRATYCGLRCPSCGFEVGGILRPENVVDHWNRYVAAERIKLHGANDR